MKKEWTHIVTQGFVAGLIGYAVVAVLVALFDVLGGRRLFHTPALIGSAMFYGLEDPSVLRIWPGPVLAFNGVHLMVFQFLGFVAAWLAYLSQRGPQFWYIGAVLFILVLFHLFAFVLFLSEGVRVALTPWQLFASGALATVAMAAYLVAARPELRVELAHYRDA